MAAPSAVPIWVVDSDAGIDDAQAVALMLRAAEKGEIKLLAITSTYGNVALHHTTANLAAICHAWGVRVPIYPGAAGPLVHPLEENAEAWHGGDGMGGHGHGARAPKDLVQEEHAACAIARLAKEVAETGAKLNLLTLGPLTNLALALRLHPGLPALLGRVVVMGGSYRAVGNANAVAEYNVWTDPEAACVILEHGGFPEIVLSTWELTMEHGLDAAFLRKWLGEEVHALAVSSGATATAIAAAEAAAADALAPVAAGGAAAGVPPEKLPMPASLAGAAEDGSTDGDASPSAPASAAVLTRRAEWLASITTHMVKVSRAAWPTVFEVSVDKPADIHPDTLIGLPIPDPLAACIALRPSLVTKAVRRAVSVELAGRLTRGQTVVDWDGRFKRAANVHVVTALDMAGVKALLLDSVVEPQAAPAS